MIGSSQERTGASRVGNCVGWAWQELDRALVDERTDPGSCLPFIHPETRYFYWELHFRRQALAGIDLLHRLPLASKERAGEGSLRDPVAGRLTSWYANSQAARRFCDPSAWLEMDGPLVPHRGAREQGVSICVDPGVGDPRGAAVPGAPSEALAEIFTGLERVCGVAGTRTLLVNRIHGAVTARHGKLRHVSIMRGRPGQPVKLYAAVPKEGFPGLLDDIGWPGDRAEAARLAEQACADSQRVNVDLVLDGEALSSRIGFEVFSDPSPVGDLRRTAATKRALSMGLVSPEVVEGLRRWVGPFRPQVGEDRQRTVVLRWLDLKFVSHGQGELELKAYLGFRMDPPLA